MRPEVCGANFSAAFDETCSALAHGVAHGAGHGVTHGVAHQEQEQEQEQEPEKTNVQAKRKLSDSSKPTRPAVDGLNRSRKPAKPGDCPIGVNSKKWWAFPAAQRSVYLAWLQSSDTPEGVEYRRISGKRQLGEPEYLAAIGCEVQS